MLSGYLDKCFVSRNLDNLLGDRSADRNVSTVRFSARGVVRILGTWGSGNRQIAYVHRNLVLVGGCFLAWTDFWIWSSWLLVLLGLGAVLLRCVVLS